MAQNLIEIAKSLFTNDVLRRASSQFGENESAISKAISGIIPTVFAGLMIHSNTPDGSRDIATAVTDQRNSGIHGNPDNLFSTGNNDILSQGAGILKRLFGNKSDELSGLISNYSGVGSSTSNSLLSMVLPVILGLIGKNTASTEPGAIHSLLSSQRDHIRSAIPPGLNVGNIFGSLDDQSTKVLSTGSSPVKRHIDDGRETGSGSMRWLLPLLLLIAAALAAFYFFREWL